jgi:hypothetical protein
LSEDEVLNFSINLFFSKTACDLSEPFILIIMLSFLAWVILWAIITKAFFVIIIWA